MKERPILFSGPMVRAILDGQKTQTRRVVKPRKDLSFGCLLQPHELAGEVNAGSFENCPYGKPGDRLWVRETWQGPLLDSEVHEAQFREDGPEAFQNPGFCVYRATDTLDAVDVDGNELGWRPSIHMFRWASRILLEVISVRVERLNDISEKDAWAEGCEGFDDDVSGGKSGYSEYAELWESINGAGSWDVNPWVWVVEFKRVLP